MAKPKPKRTKAPKAAKPKGEKKNRAIARAPKVQMISQPDFLALIGALKRRQTKMDEVRGEMGNAVMRAVDKNNIDKRALGIFRQLDRMSDLKLKICLRELQHYLEVGGLNARAARQMDAFEEKPAKEAANGNGAAKPKRERKPKPEAEPEQMDLSQRPDLLAADTAALPN